MKKNIPVKTHRQMVAEWKRDPEFKAAYMNREAVKRTLKTRKATFWSRSRGKFWVKGESSGNIQKVKEICYDCDGDCLLVKVEQIGGAACHTGRRSFLNQKLQAALMDPTMPLKPGCFFKKKTGSLRNITAKIQYRDIAKIWPAPKF